MVNILTDKMPSPQGGDESTMGEQKKSQGDLESPGLVAQFVQEGPAKHPAENGSAKVARINAKRKPDKSKIFRIRTNDSENHNEDQLVCVLCQSEFQCNQDLEEHRMSCVMDHPRPDSSSERENPDDLRRHQDEANNNNQAVIMKSPSRNSSHNSRESSVERSAELESDSVFQEGGPLAQIRNLFQHTNSDLPIAQQLAQSNIALEAIHNTRIALAQLATNAIGNGQPTSPQAMREMAVLQSTLLSLQHQHMMQLQLIQQLQAQLSIKNKEENNFQENKTDCDSESENRDDEKERNSELPPPSSEETDKPPSNSITSSFISSLMERFKPSSVDEINDKNVQNFTSSVSVANDARDRPLSPPMTASNIASSVIQHSDPPPPEEPNTLEMLQRTANEVLNNASQGLLTNRLIDDYNKPPDGKDAYYKHRCRYCGKVFGSDSALQIHVRSHTGERPFKCNVCGNRFTTKGNLKVHFQRHSVRFPHVKMNPHPVPEHLDKLHPPLLAQLGELKDYPSPPTGPPNPFASSPIGPSIPPFRLSAPLPPNIDMNKPFNPTDLLRKDIPNVEMEEPENLSGTRNSFESDDDHRVENSEMEVDRRTPQREESREMEDDTSSSIKGSKDLENSSDKEREHVFGKSPNFRGPLQEAMQNNDREPLTDKIRESLRNSIHNHLRETIKGIGRESLDPPISKGILKDQEKSIGDSLNSIFRESIMNSNNNGYHKSQTSLAESLRNSESNNSDNGPESNGPLDIRIKADQDLKDFQEDKKNKDDMDTDSNDSRFTNSEQPTDLRVRQDFRPLPFPGMQFSGPRLPFPFLPGMSPPFMPPSGSTAPGGMIPNVDPAKDPNLYANLLPRPGSTDNSWEALIEIEKTSETMKLENLVNNIEHKLSDPNQCVICHRVLSCKSALQMHYRTHTGERPFKCKICGRAFTTKGNLKTHMGVHRAKPPMRMLHQCPVCHKKFTNALVLQQHIRLHTGEPTDLTPEQIAAAEVREFPPSLPVQSNLPPMMPGGFPLPSQPLHGFPPIPLHLRYQISPEMLRRYDMEMDERKDEEERYLRLFNNSPRSSSTSSAEQRMAEDLSLKLRNEEGMNGGSSPHHSVSPTPSDYSDIDEKGQERNGEPHTSLMDRLINPAISQAATSGQENSGGSASSTPLDLASRPPPPLFSPFGLFPPPLTSGQVSAGTQSLPNMSPLYMPNIPGRGNTTCQVCFKTFACQSALEIHYRSHTKERPFKCTVCDRGFSTKGNMKQHMLTHKMRDGCSEESGNGSGKKSSKNSACSSSTSSKDEESSDSTKRDDSGIKREREGELLLPISKRSTALSDELPNEGIHYNDEPPVLSPEVPYSPQETQSPVQNPFSLSHSATLPIQTSLPLPPTLTLPSSISFSSPLSLPLAPPPSSIGLAPSQPLPHS